MALKKPCKKCGCKHDGGCVSCGCTCPSGQRCKCCGADDRDFNERSRLCARCAAHATTVTASAANASGGTAVSTATDVMYTAGKSGMVG